MPIAIVGKPVSSSTLFGTISAAGTPVTTKSVAAGGTTETTEFIPVQFGSGGYTAYIYIKNPSVTADVSLNAVSLVGGTDTTNVVSEVIAPAGSFSTQNTWYAVDFSPHVSEKMALSVTNNGLVTEVLVVVIVKHGGA